MRNVIAAGRSKGKRSGTIVCGKNRRLGRRHDASGWNRKLDRMSSAYVQSRGLRRRSGVSMKHREQRIRPVA